MPCRVVVFLPGNWLGWEVAADEIEKTRLELIAIMKADPPTIITVPMSGGMSQTFRSNCVTGFHFTRHPRDADKYGPLLKEAVTEMRRINDESERGEAWRGDGEQDQGA